MADGKFCETTIGYRTKEDGEIFKRLFQTPMFQVQLIDDVDGVSLCGALKNIVAIAAGLCDGLDHGTNTKSAIIRIGLLDMRNFAKEYFPNVQSQTFLEESAGVADVITSCKLLPFPISKQRSSWTLLGRPYKRGHAPNKLIIRVFLSPRHIT